MLIQAIELGLVACILSAEVHDMWVCIVLQQKLDGLHLLVLNAEMQSSVAIAVYVINVGAAKNHPFGQDEVLLEQQGEKDGHRLLILNVQVARSPR